jgi:hypothetical protein
VSGLLEPRAVGGEVLAPAAARVDNRGEVGWIERLNRGPREPAGVLGGRPGRRGLIQHDGNDSPGRQQVRRDIRSDYLECGRGPRVSRELHRAEPDERPGLSILDNREVGRRQPSDRTAIAIEDRHVELHDVDPCLEWDRHLERSL